MWHQASSVINFAIQYCYSFTVIMADPVVKPLQWSKCHHVYAEKHSMFEVFQEVLKELIIWKPNDPLLYIRDEIQRIASTINTPRVFLIGTPEALRYGQQLARRTGCRFITIEEVIKSSPDSIRKHISVFLNKPDNAEDCLRQLFVAAVQRRLSMDDCSKSGYILHGFPQSKAQAIAAQQNGLLPRQVIVMLPEGEDEKALIEASESRFLMRGSNSQLSLTQLRLQKEYFVLKDIASVFPFDVLMMKEFDEWAHAKDDLIIEEFAHFLSTRRPTSAPWIPRILVLGPPACGKTMMSEHLASKFSLICLDWMDMVRGAARWPDSEIGPHCQKYLKDMTPLPREVVKEILKRKLTREDCEKKGWILQGFPTNVEQAQIMEDLCIAPNRVFLMNCSEETCIVRMAKKRKTISRRKLEDVGGTNSTPEVVSEKNICQYPYSDKAVKYRYSEMKRNWNDLIAYFGPQIISVDATPKPIIVRDFMESCILRPPIGHVSHKNRAA